jgi:hypothetical protein
LRQSPANLAGSNSHHRVDAGVIVRLPTKNLNTNGSLFQLRRAGLEGELYDIPEKAFITFAIPEGRAFQNESQVLPDAVVV